jgi:serine/threonine protein kinase
VRRERIAHYRIEGLLGAGGMGEVWSAFDEKLERRVAIKILPEERASDDARGRMLREARAAGALHHPGIVPIYDTGEIDGLSYIVMEWVEGETVAELIERRGALPPADALALVAQAADALAAAHAAGIVHRDVKAANLMIDVRGQVRVLDFGLSKRLGASHGPTAPIAAVDPEAATVAPTSATDDDDSDGWSLATDQTLPATPAPSRPPGSHSSRPSREAVTELGSRMGTPGYAAPELIAGREADARSDIFSLAVVLYELVTGARPFVATTWAALEAEIHAGPRPASVASKGAVGPAFDAALARALAPNRRERYHAVGELIDAARAGLAVARPRPRRRGWLYAGGAAVAVAGGAAIVVAATRGGAAARDPDPAPAPAPAIASRPLTSLGGCAEGPIFADDHTIVFDVTRDGAVSLYEVGRAGGAPRRLTTGPTWDWRAAPGHKPGEIVFLRTDMEHEDRSVVSTLDLATGASRVEVPVYAFAAAATADTTYYVDAGGETIRRRRGELDDSVYALPIDFGAQQLVVSPGGHLAVSVTTKASNSHICALRPDAAPICAPGDPEPGRPAWTRDGVALLYGGKDGIRRFTIDGGADTLLVPGANAYSGVALSPDGRALVWSECGYNTHLADVTAPSRSLVTDDKAHEPVAGPGGRLAWVHEGDHGASVMVRDRDGRITELVPPTFGNITALAFDHDGKNLAFVAVGDHPGIHRVATDGSDLSQVTDDKGDSTPYWTRDERIAFGRIDDRGVWHVFLVSADGGKPVQAFAATRQLSGADLATGRLLLSAGTKVRWWDPVAGTESDPLSLPPAVFNLAVSPGGRWLLIQTGTAGLTFLRAPIGDPAHGVRIAELPSDETVWNATIDDDGRAIGTPGVWRGELRIADGAFDP